jgi:hypothetical protein
MDRQYEVGCRDIEYAYGRGIMVVMYCRIEALGKLSLSLILDWKELLNLSSSNVQRLWNKSFMSYKVLPCNGADGCNWHCLPILLDYTHHPRYFSVVP